MTDATAETAPCIEAQSTLMAGNYQNEAQALIRSACSECRRRKQKCLRYWPCHHCGTRRVGDQCIFRTVLDVQTLEDRKTQIDQFLSRMKGKCCFAHPFGEEIDGGSDDTWEDVQQFGYKLPDQEKVPKYTTQYLMRPADCPELQTALRAIPSRECLGANREAVRRRSVSSAYRKEMGRRAWIVINIWDWQIAALLSRSRILEDKEYNTRLPNLKFNKEPKESLRSPIVSMALQCELASSISKRFGKKAYEAEEHEAMAARNRGTRVMRPYPPYVAELLGNYSSLDASHRWLSLEGFIVSTMHLSSALAPLRPYLIKPLSQASPAAELGLRQEGVSIAIKYMLNLFKFLRYLFPLHKKYQTVVFFIFDAATLLCSTIIHDSDESMPMRDQSWAAVQGTITMLRTLKPYAPIANKAFEVLDLIHSEMLSQHTDEDEMRRRGRPKVTTAISIWPIIHIRADSASESYNFSFEIPKNSRAYAPDIVPPHTSDVGYSSEPGARERRFRDRRQRTTAPLHPAALQLQPLHNNGDIAMADEPSSLSTEMFSLDGSHAILTHVNKPKKPVRKKAKANRPSVKIPGYIPEWELSPWVTGLGILEGLWDYDRVNLGILSPHLAN
ncbi:hypothetical protein ACHAQJ_004304 [Trichoderma viride]